MNRGKVVYTKRNGHGYLYEKNMTGAKIVTVHLISNQFNLTGKTVRCKMESLEILGNIEKSKTI